MKQVCNQSDVKSYGIDPHQAYVDIDIVRPFFFCPMLIESLVI